jgi:hypothetical protein
VVPAGADPSAPAYIESRRLILTRQAVAEDGRVVLEGTVLRLALIRRTGQVVVTAAVGELALTAVLAPEVLREEGMAPGDKISVAYVPSDVSWIDAA